MMSIGRYCFVCRLIQLTIRQLIKYLYIFQWKHVVSLNDDFFAIYFTLCNILLSFLFIYSLYLLGFHNSEVDYHLCSGKHPEDNILEEFLRIKKFVKLEKSPLTYEEIILKDPLRGLTFILFFILFFLAFQTLFFSKKETFKTIWKRKNVIVPNSSQYQPNKNTKFEETKHLILGEGGTLTFIFAIILAYAPISITKSLFSQDPNILNSGTGQLWYYGSKISLATMTNCIPPIIIIVGNSKMRNTLKREILHSLIGLNFKGQFKFY